MIQQCVDLALGRAFTPDPLDPSVPLHRRFAKRPLVALTLYKDGFEAAPLSFAGDVPACGRPEFFPTGGEDADAATLRSFAERHKASECLINLTTGYTAILSSRARRPENEEEALALMRDNPERILGEPPAQGCRHSVAFHPTHHFSIVFAHRESDIAMASALAAKADLGVARMQCGMASLLIQLVGNHWSDVGPEAELLFVGRGSLFYLAAAENSFGRPLFDIGMKEAALRQALGERIGKLKPGGRVLLVNDTEWDVEAMILEKNPSTTVAQPLKERSPAALFACASDRPQLGYDLFPGERAVRPFAPGSLRFVPAVFWAAAALAGTVVGINGVRNTLAARQEARLKGQSTLFDAARQQATGTIRTAQAHLHTASAIGDWLQLSPSTQSLLMALTDEIKGADEQGAKEGKASAQIESLSLTRQEGQPQMRLAIVILGDAASANRIFQRMSALFGRLGYSTVDLKQQLVPGGFRYEHLLNVPKAVVP